MANISLGQLYTVWKNVSDWVTGTSSSKPAVVATIDNLPTNQNVSMSGRIIKDSFSGSTTITKTYQTSVQGFSIINDGATDITFTINNLSFTVMSGEDFNGVFDPFTTVTINTTSPYRAVIRQ